MSNEKIFAMQFNKVFPLLIAKQSARAEPKPKYTK